jgi:hypothetical protein
VIVINLPGIDYVQVSKISKYGPIARLTSVSYKSTEESNSETPKDLYSLYQKGNALYGNLYS